MSEIEAKVLIAPQAQAGGKKMQEKGSQREFVVWR